MNANEIICTFQDEEYLREFCEKNGFPQISRNCIRFDVHTHEQKIRETNDYQEPEKVITKFSKFLKPTAKITDTEVYHYGSDKFPYWVDLPKINGYNDTSGRDASNYAKIMFVFRNDDTIEFKKKVFYWVNITEKTTDVKLCDERFKYITSHVIPIDYEDKPRIPRYPIYIISKGRAYLKNGTSGLLSRLEIPHYIVVEPDEYDEYVKNLGDEYTTILKFDMSYIDKYDKGKSFGNDNIVGPGPKRNFVWDHSTANGDKWHWVMDDNAYYMKVRFFNYRFYTYTANWICALEDYVDMFENVGQAGLDYNFFHPDLTDDTPYIQNTRCFSFILNNNFITDKNGKHYRWEGRYSEDVDLSVRILKDGWCTMDFRQVLMQKAKTQTLAGGCNGEIYENEGTYAKSKFIAEKHSDCCEVVMKYGRIHHYVNYGIFKQELKLKPEYADKVKNDKYKFNDYGVVLIAIDDEDTNYCKSRKYIHEKYGDRIKGPQQYFYVDVKNCDKELLKKTLAESMKKDRSPLVFTDIYGTNSVNEVTRLCREMKIPSMNYLYYYDKENVVKFNNNLAHIPEVTVITNKDTILHNNLKNIEVDKLIVL